MNVNSETRLNEAERDTERDRETGRRNTPCERKQVRDYYLCAKDWTRGPDGGGVGTVE